MPGKANPEAIAWYLVRSEGLLEELRKRVESLRTHGGQLAGFSGAVLALAGRMSQRSSAHFTALLEMVPGSAFCSACSS